MIEGHAYIFHLMPIYQAPASAHIAPGNGCFDNYSHILAFQPGDDFTPRALTVLVHA